MEIKVYEYLPTAAKNIRKIVFIAEQGFENEFDDIDNIAKHIVIYEDNLAIGTCRIFYNNERKYYQIGRIAIIKEYKGKGYGNILLDASETEIIKNNGNIIELALQKRISHFYLKNGFTMLNEKYNDEGCPHIWMKKIINNNP